MQHGGRQRLQHPGLPGVSAMDDFPDGAFVSLRNRVKGTYLAADDDGENVSLRPFSLNAVWRLQRVEVDGGTSVLLQGAAYGRYLAMAPRLSRAPSGCRGRRAVQHDYDGDDDVGAFAWRPFRILEDRRYIVLRHNFNGNLRGNGRYRVWHTAVTVDDNEGRWGTMMQWTLRRFQPAPGLPPLPPPTVILGARSGLFRRRRPEADNRRIIGHVRANDEGDFDQNYNNWGSFPFYGRSVFNLRVQVGMRQPGVEVGGGGIILAVKPGSEGLLIPLVTDLPRSVDVMAIVVFNTGSRGAQNLVYPDI